MVVEQRGHAMRKGQHNTSSHTLCSKLIHLVELATSIHNCRISKKIERPTPLDVPIQTPPVRQSALMLLATTACRGRPSAKNCTGEWLNVHMSRLSPPTIGSGLAGQTVHISPSGFPVADQATVAESARSYHGRNVACPDPEDCPADAELMKTELRRAWAYFEPGCARRRRTRTHWSPPHILTTGKRRALRSSSRRNNV